MAQPVWNVAKAVLRGKFIVIQAYLKKQETSQMNNLTLHLKQLGRKKERKRKKAGRREGERKKKREIKQVFKYHGPKWQGGADKCPVWLREHIVQKPS